MITGIKFGGLSKPSPEPSPLVAPLPAEYKQPVQLITIKNPTPKPQ
jgi:hypothetical protein